MMGEGLWKLRLVFGGQVREFADGGIFCQKVMQLFVVEDLGCEESWRWSSGGLGR